MKLAKGLSILGIIAMSIALLNGFIFGNFSQDGRDLMQNPWGIVSLVDLYVGFILFSLWIAFREEKIIVKIVWIVGMMIFGWFIGSIYILYALLDSKNDWYTFFLGYKKETLINK